MKRYWHSSSCGRIEIHMTLEQARGASHQGQCDDDVAALAREPDIAEQLAKIDPATLIRELEGYGAWDATELADHEQNLIRFLWLAASTIQDENVDAHS